MLVAPPDPIVSVNTYTWPGIVGFAAGSNPTAVRVQRVPATAVVAPVVTTVVPDVPVSLIFNVAETPEVLEMDLNPIFAYPDGAMAVDARVILGE